MRAVASAALVAATLGAPLALAQSTDAGASAPGATAEAPATNAPSASTGTGTSSSDAHELPPEEAKAPKRKSIPLPLSIMGGLRVGVLIPAGDIGQAPQLPIPVDPAVDLALELGATIYEHYYAGLIFGGSFYISPANSQKNVNAILFGTEGGYILNPNGKLGAFFGLGIGLRNYFIGDALGNANSVSGPDLLATVALHVRAGSAIRLLPRFDFMLGPAGGYTHALFLFGLSVWLNHDVFKKPDHE